MPARCSKCGLVFQSTGGIVIGPGSTNVTMFGNKIDCPRCGAWANFIDGTFDVVGVPNAAGVTETGSLQGAIVMKSGPQWSKDVIDSLRLGLAHIVENPPANPVAAVAALDADFAEALAQAVDEGLRRSATKATSKNRRALFLKGAAFVSTLLMTDYNVGIHNVEFIAQKVGELLTFISTHGALPPGPTG